ncbi:MAG: hypothetical protein J6B95_09625 [Oscillospiraceae bacterium]|nr:hypothetical protein [Oscillospiraceae bacterium]
MAEFKIKIAGRVIRVRSLFESTRDYCRAYLTEENPELSVEVTAENLLFEQEQYDEEAREEGFRRRRFTDPFLERTAIQRKIAEFLFDDRVLMVHGSAVALDGAGYLFTARSGTGKSTHTRLWREVFGSRAVMVNDDKPFVRLGAQEPLVCGSPWSGKHGLDTNITVPLKGICILVRGSENRIRRLEPTQALDLLRHQSYRPLDIRKLPQFLTMTQALAERIPLWHMECTMDPQAAQLAWEAMTSQGQV